MRNYCIEVRNRRSNVLKYMRQLIHHFNFCIHHAVSVAVECYRYILMPHDLGERLDIHSALDCTCCEGMTQGMEIEFPDSGSFRELFKYVLV